MYYAFDPETGKFKFSADTPFTHEDPLVVIEGEGGMDVSDIKAVEVDGKWAIAKIKSDAERAKEVRATYKAAELAHASEQITMLTDVVEYVDPSMAETLSAWRAYRAAVYVLDPADESVDWPTRPDDK